MERPKNLNEALLPITTLFAILGHSVFQCPVGRRRILFSGVYSTIVGGSYFAIFATIFKFICAIGWFDGVKKSFLIVTLINMGMATTAQIIGWYHYKTSERILCRTMRVDDTLKKLGANFDYPKCKKIVISTIIFWFALVIVLNSMQIRRMIDDQSSFGLTLTIIATLQHASFVNTLVGLNFSLAVSCIEVRFRKLNELLVSASESRFFEISKNSDVVYFLGKGNIKSNRSIVIPPRAFPRFDEKCKNIVRTVRHVHLELTDISRCLNRTYGIQLTLQMASGFVSFTALAHDMFTVARDPLADRRTERLFIGTSWGVAALVVLFIINYCCEKFSVEANRTGLLIHCMQNSKKELELLDEIVQFSYQLMNNTAHFAPGGFFTLGYPFMRGFLGSVVTYVVILIQMDPKSTAS